jgi:SAM-dependent methyltransferase
MSVLEIGCGTWSLLKTICIQAGALYEGIDTQAEYYGKPTIATKIENLQDLSFLDETFDLVIGSQTIEHWAEFGCDTAFGLYQCFRVCKVGGTVIMNAPVHFHGSRPFLMGDFDAIRNLFQTYSNAITIEPWGLESDPIPKFYTYKKYLALSGKHAYIIDIRAVKSSAMVKIPAIILMPLKLRRWINYPFSFLIYRAKLKLGLIRE